MMIFVQIIELCYVEFHKVLIKFILFADDTNVFYAGTSITARVR